MSSVHTFKDMRIGRKPELGSGTPVPFWSDASVRLAIDKLRAEKEAKDRKKD
jgi:hypothetical protein